MPEIETTHFMGSSLASYVFEVYPLDTKFENVGAVYVLAWGVKTKSSKNLYCVEHIGQTSELSNHLRDQDKEGANCVCVRFGENEESRKRIVNDLNSWYQGNTDGKVTTVSSSEG